MQFTGGRKILIVIMDFVSLCVTRQDADIVSPLKVIVNHTCIPYLPSNEEQ
jgi:hypothetical protein